MKTEYILSIIIPVWNTSCDLLYRSVYSLIKNKNSDIEIIVVDDGSKADTALFLDKLCDKDAVIIHQRNSGQNMARQAGVDISKGKYIGFLDSDDYFDVAMLNEVIPLLKHSTAEILPYNYRIVDEKCKVLPQQTDTVNSFTSKSQYVYSCAELWRQFIRRDFLINKGGLYTPKGVCIGEDIASILPLIVKANSIECLNYILYNYCRRSDSVMSSPARNNRLSILNSFEYILRSLDKSELDTYLDEIEWQAINHVLYCETLTQLKLGMKALRSVKILFTWTNFHFPNWRSNRYIADGYKKHGISLKLVLHHHFLLIIFYQTIIRRFLTK